MEGMLTLHTGIHRPLFHHMGYQEPEINKDISCFELRSVLYTTGSRINVLTFTKPVP